MELRGFDTFEVTLGDEMRGERASLGKSLEDTERDLRIKARMITAIENSDLSGFPNQSVIAGYVRSYARYLGMNAEDCYQRFCEESGYQSPAALMSSSGDGSAFVSLNKTAAVTSSVGAEIAQSRFAAPPTQTRFQARISMGALTSTFALLALIAGLGYGGYALLQDIQRVGVAPLPEAPDVVADAPEISVPALEQQQFARPSASDYEGGGALAALRLPDELPQINKLRRDGPISAIDPTKAGMFARVEAPPQPSGDTDLAMGDDLETIPPLYDEQLIAPESDGSDRTASIAVVDTGVIVHASEKAWVRVRDKSQATIWEGTLEPGQRFQLPDRTDAPELRSGNPGGIFIFIDGVPYGPVGERGQPRTVSLVIDDVRETMPQANPPAFERAELLDTEERAEVRLKNE